MEGRRSVEKSRAHSGENWRDLDENGSAARRWVHLRSEIRDAVEA